MKNFDEQLLRLKQAVKLTADQDVAALLGMTKEAFFQRKKRDAFPEDKVFALATRRPDLHLDVLYIMVGDKKDAAIQLTVDELEAALEFGAGKRGSIAEQLSRAAALVEEMHAQLPTDEQMWLDCYREWSASVKKRELKRAMGISAEGNESNATAPTVTSAAPSHRANMSGMTMKNTADGAVQVGYAAGKVSVKKGR